LESGPVGKLLPSMAIHIGTSGWSYDHWQGVLYPDPTPVHDRLRFYVEQLNTTVSTRITCTPVAGLPPGCG
jgi:hypothetical protein